MVGEGRPSRLDEEARYRLLKHVVDKYGQKCVYEKIDISRTTMWRLFEGKSPVKPEYVKPILKLLTREEFESIIEARLRLRAIGIVRDESSVDYGLALEILAIAKDNECLKKRNTEIRNAGV